MRGTIVSPIFFNLLFLYGRNYYKKNYSFNFINLPVFCTELQKPKAVPVIYGSFTIATHGQIIAANTE